MFLEMWMIGVLIVMWGAGMYHLHGVGRSEGIGIATELTLGMLQHQGLIDIIEGEDGNDTIVKAIPTPQEIREMFYALENENE